MKRSEIHRRDFNRLTTAAFGGLLAGSVIGCKSGDDDASDDAGDSSAGDTGDDTSSTIPQTTTVSAEKHICRGLNSCESQGASGDNACAGQGACATIAKHDCASMNECKGQGGCGETVGTNECKEMGGCQVPLMSDKWVEARTAFEEKMKAAGTVVGAAPAAS